jgi:hypothetical protein
MMINKVTYKRLSPTLRTYSGAGLVNAVADIVEEYRNINPEVRYGGTACSARG